MPLAVHFTEQQARTGSTPAHGPLIDPYADLEGTSYPSSENIYEGDLLTDGLHISQDLFSSPSWNSVTTVTTRNSRRPKTHAKANTDTRERVQRPSTEPQRVSEQCEHARYLSYFR